ncbi:SgcJ/EcaC family oxidoreductase [Gimesia aquarii]|uniref:SnoaL-like domain protein n=1 Tax=Gimesia aquarii TaxID=2527964 RepID=A0A517VUB7_9PLAN|nr:SgcJ/EcaC family oxidoreductase [Gimesia aquarii]QDT96602.1 SnoaL-like domain protein [Gimesia aquarii]
MRLTVTLATLVFISGIVNAFCEDPSVAQSSSDSSADLKAIQAAGQAFIKAFNHRDADAIATMWDEDGDYIDETGTVYSGREAIKNEFERYFHNSYGRKVQVHPKSIRFIQPDVVLIDGTSEVDPPPPGKPVMGRFSAIRVKKDGKWLLTSVRESAVEVPSNYEHLKHLEWMLGEWVDKDESSSIYTSAVWSKNKNFIIRKFKVNLNGRIVLSGSQRVGWDPIRKQIKSWTFDSDGGVAEGYWSQKGNQWIVRKSSVLQDGRHASATNIYTIINDDSFLWESKNRIVGQEHEPDIEQVKVVRLPPAIAP